ncbi:MAG: NYN domain-containing protein [archaeon]
MEDTIIFVDDGFFRLVKRYFQKKSGKKKKFLQTFKNICKNENLNLKHMYVYVAPPFQSNTPTDDEKYRKKKYDNFKKMLDKKNWITVREGRCQKIITKEGDLIFNQKGVDSWIVADLCLFREEFPKIKKIILISSDSDFAPIISMIKEKMKIEVVLYTYFENKRESEFYRSNYLLKVVSRWVKFNNKIFEDSEIPKSK